MLHHDNGATHKTTIMTEYLHNERVELFPHLPCSPDRAPCNFFLFSRIKKQLKGKRFNKVENLARAVQAVAETTPKADYEKSFQWRVFCGNKIVVSIIIMKFLEIKRRIFYLSIVFI